jgi:hypothetical protein
MALFGVPADNAKSPPTARDFRLDRHPPGGYRLSRASWRRAPSNTNSRVEQVPKEDVILRGLVSKCVAVPQRGTEHVAPPAVVVAPPAGIPKCRFVNLVVGIQQELVFISFSACETVGDVRVKGVATEPEIVSENLVLAILRRETPRGY